MSEFTAHETSVAKQKTLNKMTDKLGGRTPVRIHFLDNSSKMLLLDATTQAKEVMKILLEKYEVFDIDGVLGYFGLFESRNGSAIDNALPLDTPVAPVVERWTDENSKLVFMIRLFVPCLWGLQYRDVVAAACKKPKNMLSLEAYLESAEVIDPNLLHLQYIQAVYHVITGQFPTSQEQALILGSLHFLYKFGEYNGSRHKPGFLGNRIVEFIPFRYLKKKSLEEWETILFQTLQTHQSTLLSLTNNNHHNDVVHHSTMTPQHKYMDYIYRLPNGLYGCTFFRCVADKQKNIPDIVIVGISSNGINLYDKSSDRKLIKSFNIEDLSRWGYKPNVLFYFEIQPTDEYDALIELQTGDGQKIADLLTDYALSFMKEEEKEMKRAETLDSISVEEYVKREKQLKELSNTVPVIPKNDKNTKKSNWKPKNYTPQQQENAATRIQALYRGFALRSQWAYEDAAIRIQAVYRGYRARVRVFKLIEKLMEKGNLSM
eukprot:TRINITY_DN51125_c0_g1_i1.p1 TRINITY_DN51125_c0_g1~~TRINITY_DN51125_c0_g1_i1.p1  ORF type:complete len:489 (+),score=-12.32 TRINITY_DN51125_c0_g1_i1:38-1504(+)